MALDTARPHSIDHRSERSHIEERLSKIYAAIETGTLDGSELSLMERIASLIISRATPCASLKPFLKTAESPPSGARLARRSIGPRRSRCAAVLNDAPAHDAITLCANSDGKPWTVCGFRASWRKVRLKLEAEGRVNPGLTLYGLRHTVAVVLRECGFDERTIADALGQKTIEMARHYARGADLTRKMKGVAKKFEREVSRRHAKLAGKTKRA